MSVISFPTRSDRFLSLRNAVHEMESSLKEQTYAVKRFKSVNSSLRDEMKIMGQAMRDFEKALSRINIRGVGVKSRVLASMVSH